MLLEKTVAPDFELPDQNAVHHKLSDYIGRWVVLYFYPKDDSPGCIGEACSFQEKINEFEKMNVKVLGVSADPTSSHYKFAQKYELNFTLLSDDARDVIKKYDAFGIFTKRISYLINPEGQIYKTYAEFKPDTHADTVLADLKAAGVV